MKKLFLALMCAASMTAFAQFIEPLVLEEDESTLEGYALDENLPDMVKAAYGIEDFGRVKGFDVQRAFSFSGEGEFADVADGFQFQFVPKNNGTFGHDIFLGYSKVIYDKCLKAADDGKTYNGFWNESKEINFDQSIKVFDKKRDIRKCNFYYIHNGQKREVEIVERQYQEGGGFKLLFVHLKRFGY